jgi:S1-C subfamily serine protease
MAILIVIVVVAASIFYVLPTPLARTLRTPRLSQDLANQLIRSQPGVLPTCYQDAAGLDFLTSTVVRLGTLPDARRRSININFGSGSWLGGDLILTNFHVVENSASEPLNDVPGSANAGSTLLFFQPIADDASTNNQAGLAELVEEDQRSDLAVLRVVSGPQEPMTALKLGDPRALSTGDEIVVVGFPGGVFRTYTGRVLTGSGGDWILTDAGFTEGTSGGVVLNQHCELVGVPTATTVIEGHGRVGLIRPVTLAQPLIEAAKSQ